MKRYFRKWENAKNQISEINNNKKVRPRSVTCNHYNNVIVTVSNNNLETDSNFKPKIGLKSGIRKFYSAGLIEKFRAMDSSSHRTSFHYEG